ncbi:hypothetical protein REPUB_Repub11eG0052900 [Reevesia pubescens]
MWQNNFFSKEGACCTRFFNAIWDNLLDFNLKILIINVYAPCNAADRKAIWDSLSVFIQNFHLPCILAGDFNVIRSLDERKFCLVESAGKHDFNEFIFANFLVDNPVVGKKFTWYGRERKRSRLDRILISDSLFDYFPNLNVMALNMSLFDHIPLLLERMGTNLGQKPVRFFNWWMSRHGHEEIVSSAWSRNNAQGWASHRLLMKLKEVKNSLKTWTKEVSMHQWTQIQAIESDLDNLICSHDLDASVENWSKSDFGTKTRDLRNEYNLLESVWKQKSGLRWLKEEDQDSGYLHSICISR